MKKSTGQEAKLRIAEAFQALLEEKDISRISVSEIMRTCGMTRQMFYHYFRDVDDLVFWIHLNNILRFSEEFFEEENFIKALGQALEAMVREKKFYKDVIKGEGPNSFSCLFYENVMENTRRFLGKKKLTEDVEFAMQVYWKGVTAVIEEWIKGGMKLEPKELSIKCYRSLPAVLIRFYE